MTKVRFKVEFETDQKENDPAEAVNEKFSNKIIEYQTVPRIGEWIDLLELSRHYDLSDKELEWLSAREHKYRIENVCKCEGYIEAELDIDKVWPKEA